MQNRVFSAPAATAVTRTRPLTDGRWVELRWRESVASRGIRGKSLGVQQRSWAGSVQPWTQVNTPHEAAQRLHGASAWRLSSRLSSLGSGQFQ